MRVYLCRCLFLRKQVQILYFPHEKQRKGSADKPDSRRCSFPQEMEEAGGVQRGLKSRLAPSSAPSGRSLVPFWRARKEPKSAQRGLKRVQVWTSAPSGLPPPLPFLAGKSSGGCPACRHFPCAVFRVENTKFALVCAKRDSGTGTHAFSRLFAVLCILRNRTVNTAS